MFNAEQYVIQGLLEEFKPRPRMHQNRPTYVGIDGKEFDHRHHNTMSVADQLRGAINSASDVDNYVNLRRYHTGLRSRRNR